MSYVVEVPVENGGILLVQASEDDLPSGLELAALHPGEIVGRAGRTLEHALDQLKPALQAIRGRLTAVAPGGVSIEFGIVLGVETGVVVAKGTQEVHFTVTLTWQDSGAGESGTGDG